MDTEWQKKYDQKLIRNLEKVCGNPFAKFQVSLALGDLASVSQLQHCWLDVK